VTTDHQELMNELRALRSELAELREARTGSTRMP
jgi:ribosomal protein L19E